MIRNSAAWLTDSDNRPAMVRTGGAVVFRPDRPASVPAAGTPHAPASPRASRAAARSKIAGRRLGRYRLIERLGQGTQGDVWKALQLEPVEQEVALKVLPPSLANEPWRLAQFRHEAAVGLSLSNPSLLPVYEFAEVNGITFLAMPFIDGCTLGDVINQRSAALRGHLSTECDGRILLPKDEYFRAVAYIFLKVAGALQVAHAAGVIHRDIKPSNILLDRERDERVFLCDFGLGFDLNLPRTDGLEAGVGSPLYMPPEKLVAMEGVDEVRCDVYALGVSLFEALTLQQPLSIPADLPRSKWAEHLVISRPPRPREVDPAIPDPLDAIVRKAMQRSAASRYPSAAQVGADLLAFLRTRTSPVR